MPSRSVGSTLVRALGTRRLVPADNDLVPNSAQPPVCQSLLAILLQDIHRTERCLTVESHCRIAIIPASALGKPTGCRQGAASGRRDRGTDDRAVGLRFRVGCPVRALQSTKLRSTVARRLPKSSHGWKTNPNPGITTSRACGAEAVAMGYAAMGNADWAGLLTVAGPRFDELVREVGLK